METEHAEPGSHLKHLKRSAHRSVDIPTPARRKPPGFIYVRDGDYHYLSFQSMMWSFRLFDIRRNGWYGRRAGDRAPAYPGCVKWRNRLSGIIEEIVGQSPACNFASGGLEPSEDDSNADCAAAWQSSGSVITSNFDLISFVGMSFPWLSQASGPESRWNPLHAGNIHHP